MGVLGLFNFVDSILPNIVHMLAPSYLPRDPDGTINKIPGLGFVVVIALVLLVGWVSSFFVGVSWFHCLIRYWKKHPASNSFILP
jgi:uncharacterized membrane protein